MADRPVARRVARPRDPAPREGPRSRTESAAKRDKTAPAPVPAKPPAASRVSLQQFMLPEHANPYGNVHGGVIVKMIDETGAIAAMRHAQSACVTVAIDSMSFLWPVHVGELLCCSAVVNWVGETSIEVEVRVHAENPMTGAVTHTNSAYLVYVAVDEHGRKAQVPLLCLETAEDRARHREALRRQRHRLAAGRR